MESEYGSVSRLRLVTVVQEAAVLDGALVRTPTNAAQEARRYLKGKDREHFVALHLDAKHRAVAIETISIGTLNASLIHPREVFKGAILSNAVAIICAHNHPSGDVQPSSEDQSVYQRLKDAGELLGITLLDFLIVSDAAVWAASEHWT